MLGSSLRPSFDGNRYMLRDTLGFPKAPSTLLAERKPFCNLIGILMFLAIGISVSPPTIDPDFDSRTILGV